ncbi:MAG: T9SS C-terminal target domain-containing protein, partial [Calditrichaeota bacterium]
GEWREFEVIADTVFQFAKPVPFTHYRTVHGPVIGADLANKQVYALKMTFWQQELEMMKAMFGIFQAQTLSEVESFAAMIPMSFNLFYAGKDQTIKFWHVGKYQDRRDGVDPRLPHKGDGSEEWHGFIDFKDLPHAENPAQGYFVNWNNKPVAWWNNGDNIPWGADSAFTHRVEKIDRFVGPIQGFSFENLKDVPRQIQSHGTYQQAIELSTENIIDENILPPGQSGFISLSGKKSPHFDDQWPLHLNWQFKDMLFGTDVTSDVRSAGVVPQRFVLLQNYPNPFNPVSLIKYRLAKSSHVRLQVLDVRGRVVQILIEGKKPAGEYEQTWDARNLASGVYFIRIEAGAFVASRKAVLLK